MKAAKPVDPAPLRPTSQIGGCRRSCIDSILVAGIVVLLLAILYTFRCSHLPRLTKRA
jgi:hypothetical protein